MAAEQKQKLEQQLWNIANTLRGKMDADDFRDYILGFIFKKVPEYQNGFVCQHHTETRRFDFSRN